MQRRSSNSIFSIVWNQNPDKDTLYVCIGPSFSASQPLEIYAISHVSERHTAQRVSRLTDGGFNNVRLPIQQPGRDQVRVPVDEGWRG